MGLLFWTEFVDYMTPNISEELFVDTSRSPNIQINVDIIVPKISCDCKFLMYFYMHFTLYCMLVLALDAMDSSGEQHLELSHHIYKRKLDLEGNPMEEPKRENITVKVKSESAKVYEFIMSQTNIINLLVLG